MITIQTRMVLFLLIGFLLSWCLKASAAEIFFNQAFTESVPVDSWTEIRDQGIIKQRFDYSCGSATVATVLRHFYRLEVDEVTIIDKIGLKDEFSFADLARVMEEYALKAVAVALDFGHLQRMTMPAIVYLDFHGQGHFSVLRGISSSSVWLGDPAWGNIHMSPDRFRGMWETRDDEQAPGKILIALPHSRDLSSVDASFFGLAHAKRKKGYLQFIDPTRDWNR